MAVKTWPSTLQIGWIDISVEFDVQFSITRNGAIYSYGLPGARFNVTLGFEPELETMQRPRIEALLMSLRGGANLLSMPAHLGRPRPNGSLSGTPVLQSAIGIGVLSATLTNCNGTLRAGDMIGIGDQVVMIETDATPSGGNMTVAFNPPMRSAHASNTPVVWNRPSILWLPKSNIAGPWGYRPGLVRPGFSIELVEAY